jgi:hypothetical protein
MRGKPFQLGNRLGKGRPPGTRNKRTIWQEALESHALPIINQAKFLALKPNPDMTALRLCLERLVPIAKPPNSTFRLPRIRTPADLPNALSALERAVASGQLSTQEGLAMVQMIEAHRRMFEVGDFDQRLRALEQGGQEIPLEPVVQIPDEKDEDPEIPLEPIVRIPDKKDEAPEIPLEPVVQTSEKKDEEP